jgi:peptidyl-prolyl cis-trans isomerase A (cyclophilin A)
MRTITSLFLILSLVLLGSCGWGEDETAEPITEQAAAEKTDTPPDRSSAVPTDVDKEKTEMKETKPPETKASPAAPKPAADKPAPQPKKAAPPTPHPGLTNPGKAAEKAPDQFKVRLTTTKGDIVIQVNRAWAPRGADRFYNLVKVGYFTDIAFFRVIKGFMVQFGIHGNPDIATMWKSANIQDDPVTQSNARGTITFATAGPNTRTTQLFINFGDNSGLDRQGFSPFGRVVEGMSVVDSIYDGYGEGAPRGRGPNQGLIQTQGNKYLKAQYPNLDYIKNARIDD